MATPANPTPAPTPASPIAADSTAAPHVADWVERNRNLIFGIAAGVIVAVIAGVYYLVEYVPSRNTEGIEQMASAQRFYEKDSLDRAMRDGQYPGLETLADEYSGTPAGNLSKLYLGLTQLRQKKYTEAAETIEGYSRGKNMVGVTALAALGFAYEGQQEYTKAADNFRRAADLVPNSQTTPYYLMQAARVLEYASENERAAELYRRIQREYPTSSEGQQVDKYIARLVPDTHE
jgi:tetratricopeptide (TPR) repeat protein